MTIRTAVPGDVAEVIALAGDREACDLATVPGHRHWMVLDAPDGGLAAAMLVSFDRSAEDARAHLAVLAIAPRFSGAGIEGRMLGVARAIASAFGCAGLDVPDGERTA